MKPPKDAEPPAPAPDLDPAPDLPVGTLARIRPERNERRFYHLEICPDLFGGVLLARNWDRIGTAGRLRFDHHPDGQAALAALRRLTDAKRRRGYRDQPV